MEAEQFKGFGHSTGMGNNPAIVVIDFMKGFTDSASPLGSDFSKQIQATKELLDEARERSIPIIFTAVVYENHYKDAAHFIEKIPALKCLTMESEWVEIDTQLERNKEAEPLIIKKFASAFFGTNLASLLTYEKVDTVIITGCSTSGCVRATAVDAVQYGYRVVIPEECVGDRSEKAHKANLYDIQTKYGDVVGMKTVKNYLKNLKGDKSHV